MGARATVPAGGDDMRSWLVFTVLAGICGAAAGGSSQVSDVQQLGSVMERYRSAWLAGDGQGVRALVASDAVLLPHQGDPPVEGLDAIERYWWPAAAAPTPILAFDQRVAHGEVRGDGG